MKRVSQHSAEIQNNRCSEDRKRIFNMLLIFGVSIFCILSKYSVVSEILLNGLVFFADTSGDAIVKASCRKKCSMLLMHILNFLNSNVPCSVETAGYFTLHKF